MIAGLLCLFAGILAALSLPVMPSPTAGVLLLLIALSLMRLRAARPVSWALAGCALVVLEAGARLSADELAAFVAERAQADPATVRFEDGKVPLYPGDLHGTQLEAAVEQALIAIGG